MVGLVISFVSIVALILATTLMLKNANRQTLGGQICKEIKHKLKINQSDEVIKTFLKSKYKLSNYESGLILSMVKHDHDDFVIKYISNKIQNGKTNTNVVGGKNSH